MSKLDFQKQINKFEVEFVVNSDFNLHIERPTSGAIYVQVKSTSEGAYDSIQGLDIGYADLVFDSDFSALVYPKYIRIVSDVKPTLAILTLSE